MTPPSKWLGFAFLPVIMGASDCSDGGGGDCTDTGPQSVVFDISNDDLATDYGVADASAVDADTCEAICEDNAGMVEVTTCDATDDQKKGAATIHCEGTFDC